MKIKQYICKHEIVSATRQDLVPQKCHKCQRGFSIMQLMIWEERGKNKNIFSRISIMREFDEQNRFVDSPEFKIPKMFNDISGYIFFKLSGRSEVSSKELQEHVDKLLIMCRTFQAASREMVAVDKTKEE